ncbi:hypothetical protein KKG46_05505 [Patescibacteria group bacterium]|nr:hypothetical protein [Patescibacteria group bacterium]
MSEQTTTEQNTEEIIDYKKMNLDTNYSGYDAKTSKKEETYSYKGWLISDSFIKRAMAVLGYQFVASLIINAVIFGIIIGFVVVFGIIGGLLKLAFN